MLKRAPLLLAAIVAMLLMVPAISGADVASTFRVALTTPTALSNVDAVAHHNAYVVLEPWEAAKARQLKAANPDLIVLVYQNFSSMTQGAGPGGLSSSGVNYQQANSTHPDWFLKNTSGARIQEGSYSYLWMADIGNRGYQRQWATNVIKLLHHGPWDGVFMDEVNTTAEYDTDPSTIAKYPNDASYQAAMRSMLATVDPRIQHSGKLAIANMGAWVQYPSVVKHWLRYVNGGMDEMFAKWSSTSGGGYRSASQWLTQVREIQTTEKLHKRFLAVTQASTSDVPAQLYGWASVLLAADGHTDYLAAPNYTGTAPTLSAYNAPLGHPLGKMTSLHNGAWQRKFSNGLVVVNPTDNTLTIPLHGTYTGSGLTKATTATLNPHGAVVLTGTRAASSSLLWWALAAVATVLGVTSIGTVRKRRTITAA